MKTKAEEKLTNVDFDLFDALYALDKKDYGYYSRLSEEQKKKFVPYMLIQWLSNVKGSEELQRYYISSVDYYANKYLLHESVSKHPELVWLMLCAASPGIGKQYHQWIPNISTNISKLKTVPKSKDILDYYKKIYPKQDESLLKELTEAFITENKKKKYIADIYPNLKIEDIETLSQMISDEDIKKYEEDRGNA